MKKNRGTTLYETRLSQGLVRGAEITRVACAFKGCPLPPEVTPSKKGSLCFAHAKQKIRTGKLKPVKPRGDIEAKWERWAKARAARWSDRSLGIKHKKCGNTLRVLVTHSNGHRGYRYCWCPACDVRIMVSPSGYQRFIPAAAHRQAQP